MGKYNPEYAQEGTVEGDVPIKEAEMKALKTAGFVFVGYLAVVAALTVIGVLRDPETGSAVASSAPLMQGNVRIDSPDVCNSGGLYLDLRPGNSGILQT